MEVSLVNTDSLPSNSLISVRFGSVRRQAPLEKIRTSSLKFPSTTDNCADPLKIEVLQTIASTRLVLQRKEASYEVNLGGKGKKDMTVGVQVKHCPSAASDPPVNSRMPALPVKFQDTAVSARNYLETHGILTYIQGLLHAIIQSRPEDPFSFMIEQLLAVKPSKPGDPPARTPSEADRQDKSSGRIMLPEKDDRVVNMLKKQEEVELKVEEAREAAPPSPQEVSKQVVKIALASAADVSQCKAPPPPPPSVSPLPPPLLSPQAPIQPPPPLPESTEAQVNTDEMFREKVRQSLVTSAKSGKLEQTVLAAHTDDMLREKAKQSLITSAKSGSLEQALREANRSKAGDATRVKSGQDFPSADSQVDLDKELQMKLRWSLGKATKEGRVEEAMTEAQNVVESKRAMEATETVQMKVRQSFVNASKDGNIEKVMGEAMTQQVRDSTPPLDAELGAQGTIREKVKNSLLTAAQDGRLEVLCQARCGKATDGISSADLQADADEAIRIKAKYNFLNAAKDGSLEEAMCKGRTEADAGEAIRMKARTSFLNAAKDGTFEQALCRARTGQTNDTSQDRPDRDTDAHIEQLRQQTKRTLVAATGDGRLDAAMQKLQSGVVNGPAVEQSRLDMQSVTAFMDGRLLSPLDSAEADVQTRAFETLVASTEDGRLEAAMAAEPDDEDCEPGGTSFLPMTKTRTAVYSTPQCLAEEQLVPRTEAVEAVPPSPQKNAEDILQIRSAITELRTENVWLKGQLGGMHNELEQLKRENLALAANK